MLDPPMADEIDYRLLAEPRRIEIAMTPVKSFGAR
jgi:hypothetical protein